MSDSDVAWFHRWIKALSREVEASENGRPSLAVEKMIANELKWHF